MNSKPAKKVSHTGEKTHKKDHAINPTVFNIKKIAVKDQEVASINHGKDSPISLPCWSTILILLVFFLGEFTTLIFSSCFMYFCCSKLSSR